MDEENKKINLESFFKRVDSVDKIASSALSKANSNLGIVNNQKSLIESLSISIEAMQEKIRDIANYIIIERKLEADREEDRRLEAEDAEQKRLMTERAAAMGEIKPQGEPGKPAESQGGGGSFLGGLIKTLGGLMAGGFALKYIGPVLLPKLLLLAKTKLFPIIGAGLKTAVTTSFKFLGGLVTKLFSPLTTAPIIGKIFKGIAFSSPFLAMGGFLGSKIFDFFSKGGKSESGTGVSVDTDSGGQVVSQTNLAEGDESMRKTLTEKELMVTPGTRVDEYGAEGGGEPSSGDLSMFDDEVKTEDKEIEDDKKKFKVTTGKKNKTLEDLERGYAARLAKIEKMKEEGRNVEMIEFEENKAGQLKYIIDLKKAEMGLIEDKGIGKSLLEAGMGEGKSSYSATTEYKFVEPIKSGTKDLDLSLRQNLETTDKLANAVSYQSGTTNKDQNGSVVVQNKPAQVTIASIKKTSSSVPFIKASKNQYLSINDVTVPPEVAKMLT